MALNVKKGDTVVVIAGKDKGKTGKVLVAMPADNSVVVAGVNIIAKHKKPRSAQDKGGIIKKENKIDASHVQVICPVCGKATRITHKEVDGKMARICKKCGANLDVVAKKVAKDAPKTTTKKTTTTKTTEKVESKTEASKAEKSVETKVAPKTATKKTTSTTDAKKPATEKKTTTKSTTKKVESK